MAFRYNPFMLKIFILFFVIFSSMKFTPAYSSSNQNYSEFSIDIGTLSDPYFFDADVDSFWFIDDSEMLNNVIIDNFSDDDVIQVLNAGDDDYSFANNGEDVNIIYNNDGIINQIVLLDVAASTDLIYGETSFEDIIGFNAFRVGNTDLPIWYQDADGDGYGDPNVFLESVTRPEGYVTDNTDCNDNNGNVNPAAAETGGDGIDQDCNGSDLLPLLTYYRDGDGDGYGSLNDYLEAEMQPEGYVSDSTDCDDEKSEINPGAEELCNGMDDNCNGVADENCDWVPEKIILASPSGTTEDTSPTFIWNEDPPSTWYYLLIWDSADNKVHDKWYKAEDIASAGICFVTLSLNFSGGEYNWWVRGWNDSGNGPWSDGMTFTISSESDDPPPAASLISPNSSVTNPIVFNWSAVPNSTWYQLWVNNGNGKPVKKKWYKSLNTGCGNGSGTCSVSMEPESFSSGNYKWWIQTWNEAGEGGWSSGMNFSISSDGGKPVAADPIGPNGEVTAPVTFTWKAVSNSSWYYLWVDDENGTQVKRWYTAEQAGCGSGTGTCTVVKSDPTSLTGDCRWWIQTYNDYGYGPWSSGLSFSVNSSGVYDIADYFPMESGNEWVYYETFVQVDTGKILENYLKRVCGDDTSLAGKTVIPIGTLYSSDGVVYDPWSTGDFSYYTLDHQGLILHGMNDIDDSGEEDLLIFNPPVIITARTMEIGDSWTSTVQVEGETVIAYFEFMGTGGTVSVPAGIFTDTIKLYESTEGYNRYIWMAKNIGIVKVDSVDKGDGGVFGIGDAELIRTNF